MKRKVYLFLALFLFINLPILGYAGSLSVKSVKKELELWRREIKRKPYVLNLKKLNNPFFGLTYQKYFRNKGGVKPFKLVGIIRTQNGNIALLQDPFSKGYIVKVGTKIGNFVVIKIAESYILVEREKYDIFGNKIKEVEKISLEKEL